MSTNIQILDSVIFPVISCNKDESEAIISRMLEGAGMPELWEAVRDQNEKMKFLLYIRGAGRINCAKTFSHIEFYYQRLFAVKMKKIAHFVRGRLPSADKQFATNFPPSQPSSTPLQSRRAVQNAKICSVLHFAVQEWAMGSMHWG